MDQTLEKFQDAVEYWNKKTKSTDKPKLEDYLAKFP